MHELYWKEQEPCRNPTLVRTLPLLELYPGWNSALAGTLPWLELCPTGTVPGWKFALLELSYNWNSALGWNSVSNGTFPLAGTLPP